MKKNVIFSACVAIAMLSAGCGDESTSTPIDSTTGSSAPTLSTAEAEHNRIPVGESSQAGLTLVATQDAPVKPGGDAAFDVVITGGKPKAVRFWIGTENAEGSVKAKAEEETQDHWHTHVEVPAPLPAGSKFWVEVEPPTGEAFKASFDMKQ